MRIKARLITITILTSLVLAGCDTVDDFITQEQVDYKSTVRGDPLSLPPDLSDSQIAPKYTAPGGVASAAAYNQTRAQANQAQAQGVQVLPTNANMKVMRSGNTRWLQINQDPNIVYPKLISFWANEGFTINRDNPAAGIIETDWAENRAKIPGNFLRRVVGSLVDVVSDSGERERFTTRLERIDGKTEVHINHQRMVETQMDRDGTTFKWLPAAEDPGLNAVMISRLMVFLGSSQQQAEKQVRQAQPVTTAQNTAVQFVGGSNVLASSLNPENTWRRVGSALSGAGFTIDKSDATAGTYSIRYLDTDNGIIRKESNIFSRLWGDKGNLSPEPFTIQIKPSGNGSTISVLNEQNQPERTTTGRRILTVIAEKF